MYWDMMHILSQKEKSGLIFRYNALISEKSQNLRVEFKTFTIDNKRSKKIAGSSRLVSSNLGCPPILVGAVGARF